MEGPYLSLEQIGAQGAAFITPPIPEDYEPLINEYGDYISNSAVSLVLPANCQIGAYDRVDLPAPYQQGAVIREVVTATDFLGRITHQVVRIQ